ncbi:hypothetical protein, partial [Klebsiella pneumoniae]|uniref:hypothetical protein n=1 Tax=Klebsiella pneumoniae TaxID=573 RepID=UPI00403F243F
PSFGFAENTNDLFVGKTLLHGDVLMWLMKTLLTSGCTNQRGAGQDTLSTSFSKATYKEKVKAATSCVKEQFKPEITQEKIT